MLVGGIAVRRLSGPLSDPRLILAGAALLTIGYLLAADMALAPILAAAALAGLGQSALHSTLQRWATDAAPDARGLGTALFATGAF
jgi:MFS family permease